MNSDQLWELVLTEIQPEVSKGTFFTLFKKTRLVSYEDNIATIAAPSKMVIDLLEKRFVPIIKKGLEKQIKKGVGIIFITKTITQQESKTPQDTGPLFHAIKEQPKVIGHLPRVRSDFTFETLAVSDSNRLAYESAKNVVKNLGTTYNPLFIYGSVGVGKTHLMQAIANKVYRDNPDAKVIYITSEEFTNDVVEAIRSNDTAKMKRRFRSVSLLIIDDVQFIAGKDKVQEELFHTFNTLIDNGGQIVLSSDKPPSEIKKLEARLSSRFLGGLTVDVQPPDFETRTAIVLKKAEKYGFPISIDVAKIIAEKEQDVRSLEGALLRVVTEATTSNKPVDAFVATKTLNNAKNQTPHTFHPDDIVKTTCDFYRIKPTQLKSPKRDASLVRVRQITMYLLKYELRLTLNDIGNILGGRDHTTVMHGIEKVENLLTTDRMLHEEILGITKVLRG